MAQGSVEDWARESWQIAHDTVYPSATHAPACPPTSPADAGLDAAQIETLIPMVRAQVLKGGLRLAKMLDDAFAGRVAMKPKYG
jgi:hypothetical protein